MQVVEVDHVQAKPLERDITGGANVVGPAIAGHHDRAVDDLADEPRLGGDDRRGTRFGQGATDDLLVVPGPVRIGGVEKGHSGIEGLADDRHPGLVVAIFGGDIAPADAHAAIAEGGDGGVEGWNASHRSHSLHRMPRVLTRAEECPRCSPARRTSTQGVLRGTRHGTRVESGWPRAIILQSCNKVWHHG